MAALMERMDQAISVSSMVRDTKDVMAKLVSGMQDHFVILRNNAPEAVLMGVPQYERLVDEIEDLRLMILAVESHQAELVDNELTSLDDMFKLAGIDPDNGMDNTL